MSGQSPGFLGCATHLLIYSLESVKLNTKLALLVTAAAWILCCGCSGVNASGSVSPATFLLPGFGSTSPKHCPGTPCETNGVPAAPELACLN